MTTITFGTNGPHSPEQTAQWAAAVAELIHCLNYATMPRAGGVECPQDVCLILGDLLSAADRLQQLIPQLAARLVDQAATGQLGDDRRTDPAVTVADANLGLGGANGAVRQLAAALRHAHNATSHLLVKEDTGGG